MSLGHFIYLSWIDFKLPFGNSILVRPGQTHGGNRSTAEKTGVQTTKTKKNSLVAQ